MSCDTKLSKGFVRKCGLRPKQGVSDKWYFNWDDVDREASQLSADKTKITALVLKAGAKIYEAQAVKTSKKVRHALAINDFGKGYIHTDEFIVGYRGDNENNAIQELVDGARIGTINKMIDTGENGETSYRVAGFESGMEITNDDFDSAANNGTSTIICATQEGEEEATGLKIFLMPAASEPSDLAETDAWITANVYVPV
ncbi:MAG: hypothetical protein V2I33_13030 [Kangiellaceae bacterium]|jgi:hypothetical protein|nr:hypothetical protein [Kangiellaceae bacterium]